MRRFMLITLMIVAGLGTASAQDAEKIAQAQAFFTTHDTSGDGVLTKQELVDGFIVQSREDRPIPTAVALLVYGKERIENCLSLGFDTADADADGLLAIEELGEAYQQDAFSDLRELC